MIKNQFGWILRTAWLTGFLFNAVFAYSTGPPNGRTGAPGEGTCRDCHSSYQLNSGPGSVIIQNAPAEYSPGETYTITVQVMHPSQQRWGFELCSRTENLGQGGTISIAQPTYTQTGSMGGITYVKHRSAGTFFGQQSGASWEFFWTAPEAGTGPITFYVAGNTANGNFDPSGDYIYTSHLTVTEAEESCTATGDINFDDALNVLDIVTLVGGIIGNNQLTPDQICAADLNSDGSLNILDVVTLVNLIVGQ